MKIRYILLFPVLMLVIAGCIQTKQQAEPSNSDMVSEDSRMRSLYTIGPGEVSFISDAAKVVVTGADPDSFELLGLCVGVAPYETYYGKDDKAVYCGSSIVNGADPATFKIVGTFFEKNPMSDAHNNFGVATDKNCFYHGPDRLTDQKGLCLRGTAFNRYFTNL